MSENDEGGPAPDRDGLLEAVVAEAVLVGTAFRLRDREALLMMLRRLTSALAALGEADAAEECPVSMRDTARGAESA